MVDTILFSLVVLRSLKDSSGRVWRAIPSHLYMIEVTYSQLTSAVNSQCESVCSLLNLLPSHQCDGPKGEQCDGPIGDGPIENDGNHFYVM